MQILIYSFVDTFFVVTSFLYHVSAMRGTTLVARLLLCLHFLMKTSKNRNGAFQQDHARAIELYTRAALVFRIKTWAIYIMMEET